MAEAGSEVKLFDHQAEFLAAAGGMDRVSARACLYYRTGAGKTLTALLGMKLWGWQEVLVVAPPSTHAAWVDTGVRHGMNVIPMSHAKFRMKSTKLDRATPVIADEFHMFGGRMGQGWAKLDRLARGLQAPMLLLSATPNYNDAERVYCVQRILDPTASAGGYLGWLYKHCVTEQDPFSMVPKVLGFYLYDDAAEFLASMPNVFHLPDDRVVPVEEKFYDQGLPDHLDEYGYNERKHRLVASGMEMRHTVRLNGLIDSTGHLRPAVMGLVRQVLDETEEGVLIYADHSTVAEAIARSIAASGTSCLIVTGATSTKEKERILGMVARGIGPRILVGSAALATGTDGLDKTCTTLLIVDDTEDDALRRQLIGRILPRGDFGSVGDRRVVRLNPCSD